MISGWDPFGARVGILTSYQIYVVLEICSAMSCTLCYSAVGAVQLVQYSKCNFFIAMYSAKCRYAGKLWKTYGIHGKGHGMAKLMP